MRSVDPTARPKRRHDQVFKLRATVAGKSPSVAILLVVALAGACSSAGGTYGGGGSAGQRQSDDRTGADDGAAAGRIPDGSGTQTGPGTGTGTTQPLPPSLPPQAGTPLPPRIPGVKIAYDFRGTMDRAHPEAAVMRLIIQDGALKGATAVQVTGSMRNLSRSATTVPLNLTGAADERGVIDLTVTGLSPETLYRVEELRVTGAAGAAETVKDPYFMATGGASRLAAARRRMVLKALAEAYDWDHDNYDRSKDYGNRGGWCDRFYSWSADGILTLEYPDYAPSYYDDHQAITSSAGLAQLAASGSVMGDMARYDGMFLGNHTFMILAFDQDKNQVWTVEGNYNNRVERSRREASGSWRIGHPTEALLKP